MPAPNGEPNQPLRVLSVFGTRPEAIKMAPLVQRLKQTSGVESLVCVTAQHRQMLDQVLQLFSINPDFDLNVMQPRQSLTQITVNVLKGMEEVLLEARPDIVLVHGDTSTTFVAGLAAFYQQVPVGHVEAGLRTGNKLSPYPEEMNRQLTGVLSDLHFAPTSRAADNLRRENKSAESIFITGNTVIDALSTTVREDYRHPVLEQLGDRQLLLMTAHRRENLGEPLARIFRAVRKVVEEHPEVALVYPVHLNPQVQEPAREILGQHPRIHLIEPLDALDFHNLEARARLILTDSGGIQEEAPAFGVPVLVLRENTERPEGVAAGTLKLVGTQEAQVYDEAHRLLVDRDAYEAMAQSVNPYGDGKASHRIVQALLHHFGRGAEKPLPYVPEA